MNEHLTDSVNRLASQITEREGRDRKRNSEAQANFLHGVEHLIIQLWKGTQIHEGFNGGINKRAGWYSKKNQGIETPLNLLTDRGWSSGKIGESYSEGHTIGGLKVYLSRLVLDIFVNQQAKN